MVNQHAAKRTQPSAARADPESGTNRQNARGGRKIRVNEVNRGAALFMARNSDQEAHSNPTSVRSDTQQATQRLESTLCVAPRDP